MKLYNLKQQLESGPDKDAARTPDAAKHTNSIFHRSFTVKKKIHFGTLFSALSLQILNLNPRDISSLSPRRRGNKLLFDQQRQEAKKRSDVVINILS